MFTGPRITLTERTLESVFSLPLTLWAYLAAPTHLAADRIRRDDNRSPYTPTILLIVLALLLQAVIDLKVFGLKATADKPLRIPFAGELDLNNPEVLALLLTSILFLAIYLVFCALLLVLSGWRMRPGKVQALSAAAAAIAACAMLVMALSGLVDIWTIRLLLTNGPPQPPMLYVFGIGKIAILLALWVVAPLRNLWVSGRAIRLAFPATDGQL